MTQAKFTRRRFTITIVVVLLVSSVSMAGGVAAESGPSVEQGPVEFSALESGDHHVEVIFQDPIEVANHEFTVVDGNGETVADTDDINQGLTNESIGRIVIDLGATDLSGDAVLRIDGENVNRTLSITTTASFVQGGHATSGEIQPGETLALVDVYGADRYYEIRTQRGELVANGTLGTDSYVTAINTQGWNPNVTYTVQFGRMSTEREVVVVPGPDAGATEETRGSPEPTADLHIHNLSVSKTNVTVAESVTVLATFENDGNATGTFVAWVANDELDRLSHQSVTGVGVGERRQIRVNVSFDRPGTYTLTLSGRQVGQVRVRDPARERFNKRYPGLDYEIWRSFLNDEGTDTTNTVSGED